MVISIKNHRLPKMHKELPEELSKQLPSWPNISEHSERENHSADQVLLRHHVIFLGDHGTPPQYY
jgi:hypothetical protein